MLLLAKYFTSGPGYASLHLNTCPTYGIYLHLPYSRTLNILFKVGDIIKQNLFVGWYVEFNQRRCYDWEHQTPFIKKNFGGKKASSRCLIGNEPQTQISVPMRD